MAKASNSSNQITEEADVVDALAAKTSGCMAEYVTGEATIGRLAKPCTNVALSMLTCGVDG